MITLIVSLFDTKYNSTSCNSCNMGTCDLPDVMYAQNLIMRAKGIHIRQITSAHVTTNMWMTPQSGVLKLRV